MIATKELVREFRDAVADGMDTGVRYVRELSEADRERLLGFLEGAGCGWLTAWLRLRLESDELTN